MSTDGRLKMGRGWQRVGTTLRPVLRYYGGKWVLAPWLISLFPAHRIYVEPFGGGASVLIRKPRSYSEVYNDLNEEIVNVFRVLRDAASGAELTRRLLLTPFARIEFKAAYTVTNDPIENARFTIIRSFMGFGTDALELARGLRSRGAVWNTTGFRSDSHKNGTTAAHDWAHYPTHIQCFIERMAGVVIECKPALELLNDHDGCDTLFYCDPPYLPSTRSSKKHEYRFEMDEAQHIELAGRLRELQGMVVISGYPSPLYDSELYADWHRIERAHFADGGGRRVEVVWMNDAARASMAQQRMEFARQPD